MADENQPFYVPLTRADGIAIWSPERRNERVPVAAPSGVSLAANAAQGERLQRMPLEFRLGLIGGLFRQWGAMDYKRHSGKYDSSLRDFTNYNFGVYTASAGIPREMAVTGAGVYNRVAGGPDTSGPSGTNPEDFEMIMAGYDDYLAGNIKPLEPQKPPGLLDEWWWSRGNRF